MSDQWVRLPKGAQVTMSRDQVKHMQGLGFGGKIVLAALILALLWVVGRSADDTPADHKPNPRPSVSAPRTAGE